MLFERRIIITSEKLSVVSLNFVFKINTDTDAFLIATNFFYIIFKADCCYPWISFSSISNAMVI